MNAPELSEAEAVQVAAFGLDKPNGILEAGAIVDCVIGTEFTPNGNGAPIVIKDRLGGRVLGLDGHGAWAVCWPNGEVYSYQASILAVRS